MTRLIAYMTTPGGLTGAPRRLLALASILKEQGIEVCIASQRASELLQVAESECFETAALETAGVLRFRHGALFKGGLAFKLRVLFDLLRQNWRLFRCVRQERGDIVWTRGSKGIAFGVLGACLSGKPLIWDIGYELSSKGAMRFLHLLGLWKARVIVMQYSCAPEHVFGKALAKKYRHKCYTITPGINLPTLLPFRQLSQKRERAKNSPFLVLNVGTICSRKNQMLLLAAASQLRQAAPALEFELWLVGEAFDEAYLELLQKRIEAANLEDVVSFLGWRTDTHELMAKADLLAMPSTDEGVPNTVQEAMVIGLPVVVSSAGGMPEIVADSDSGWVLSMDNPSDWADKIRWCCQNPEECKAVGQRASSYGVAHFGVQTWGTEYKRVIDSVVHPHPKIQENPDMH